jgi:multidrug efflux pump subunit AcrB
MGSAVTASTMTSLAVFLPLLFLKGMVGENLRDISLTMVIPFWLLSWLPLSLSPIFQQNG